MQIPIWQMIMRAGLVIKFIMLILAALSVISWAVIFIRLVWLHRAHAQNNAFSRAFAKLRSLTGIDRIKQQIRVSLFGQIAQTGAHEIKRILKDADEQRGVTDWSFFLQNQFAITQQHTDAAQARLFPRIHRGLFILAIVSTVSPFLGLLGTVWGIMNSFYQISNQGSASLPVVAPGIAEALITTIAGLAVAIPAVFFYNYLNHQAEKLEDSIDGYKETVVARVKQEILSLLFSHGNNEGTTI